MGARTTLAVVGAVAVVFVAAGMPKTAHAEPSAALVQSPIADTKPATKRFAIGAFVTGAGLGAVGGAGLMTWLADRHDRTISIVAPGYSHDFAEKFHKMALVTAIAGAGLAVIGITIFVSGYSF